MALCVFFVFGVLAIFYSGFQLTLGIGLMEAFISFVLIGGALPVVLLLVKAIREHRILHGKRFM